MAELVGPYEVVERLSASSLYEVVRVRSSDRSGTRLMHRAVDSRLGAKAVSMSAELAKRLRLRCMLRLERLQQGGPSTFALYEDVAVQAAPRGVAAIVNAGAAIVEALAEVHAAGMVYGALAPQTCLFGPQQVYLVDFGHASTAHRRQVEFGSAGELATDLRYLAPELTGRTNRAADYRADFYALGAVLYHMLCGVPPFASNDPLELVYQHLARKPEPMRSRVPGLPRFFDALVLKLLAKDPSQRYQSLEGLRADLRILGQIVAGEGADQEAVGRFDVPFSTFEMPHLYGRDRERALVMAAYERACAGSREVVLIEGYSGIGKSSLIRETYPQMTRQRATFASGKFELLDRSTPYSAWTAVLSQLVRHLLAEPESELSRVRAQLRSALQDRLGVLVEVVPEFQVLFGETPAPLSLAPAEARERFLQACCIALGAFGSRGRPVSIFLDDLQWIDGASLLLLERVLIDPACANVMLYGAFRSNEVDREHALTMVLARLRQVPGLKVSTIELSELNQQDIAKLVTYALAASDEDARQLAQLLLAKTGGNPFALLQLLRALREEGLIRFDADRLRWAFDLEVLAQAGITANVVDLILRRFEGLPAETRDVLARAAFIGSRFDAELIAEVCSLDSATVRLRLAPALAQEFVVALSEQHDASASAYRFLHDKLQEAAAACIPAQDRPLLHLRIARAMRHMIEDEKRDDLIFAKAEHLNAARSHLTERSDLLHVARVNLRAAKRAASSAAFSAALRYATEAMAGVSEDVFETDRELARGLYCARAEYEYLAGNFVAAEQFLQVAIRHERDRFVLADLFHQLIVQYTLRAEYGRAIDVARAALAEFGILLAERDLTVLRDAELQRVRELQGEVTFSCLGALPAMTSREQTAVMKLLIAMGPPCYRSHPELWGLIVATEVRICLEHGVVPGASYTFPAFGGLGMHLDLFDGGVCAQLCEATLTLLKRVSTPADTSVGYLMIGSSLRHWFAPLSASVADYQEAYQSGISSGNLQYAAYALGHLCYCRFFQGGSLVELLRELEAARAFCEQRGNRWGHDLASGVIRIATALLGRVASDSDEQAYLARCEAHKNFQVRCIYLILKCEALLHQGDYPAAAAALVQAWPSLSGVATQGLLPSAECELLRGLLVLLVPEAFELSPEAAQGEATQRARRLGGWAEHAPHFGHAAALLEAQLSAVRGDVPRALTSFERAMKLAEAGAHLPRLGLAATLCARLVDAHGLQTYAAACRQRADLAYSQWRGGGLLDSFAQSDRPAADPHHAADLDLLSVMRTAQALARSVELTEVVETVIRIVAQVSGAQRVALLLESGESLRVVADSASKLAPQEAPQALPMSLINLVRRAGRTRRVQRDLDHEVPNDPYLLAARPAAVLCTPLSLFGQVHGVLYLEHRELKSAFHQRHEVLVEMLAGMAAIAVRNAELVSALRRDLDLRTTLEQKARDSERRLTLLLEQSPLGIRVFRPSGELLFENAASLDGLAGSSNDNGNINLAGHPLLGCQPELVSRVQRGESVELGDVLVAREAAGEHWISGRVYGVTGESGEIDQIVLLEEDISERKRTERMQSEFVSAVSHELRTPLTSIRGVLGLLDGGVCGALPEQARQLVKVAADNADRLTRLVNDILDMEKLTAGKMTLHRSVLSAHDAVENALRANEGFALQHDVVLRTAPGRADDLALIRVDPDRLQQVLANLLSNAIKFSPAGGQVDVCIDVTETRVRVSVCDHGSGVPEAFRASLFQRFVQADGSDTRRHGGTGLGLSITRQLVEQMGGTIEYAPLEPSGSCFYFGFPRVAPTVGSASEVSERAGTARGTGAS